MGSYFTSYGISAYRANEEHVMVTERSTPLNGTRTGVLAFHGYQADAKAALSPTGGVYDQADTGLPLLSCDFGSNPADQSTFGDNDSITATGAALTWFQTNGAKSGKVLLAGGSMGALVALNWARQNLSSVAGITLTIPALDLQDLHDNAPGRSQNGQTVGTVYPNLATDLAASAGGVGNLTAGYYSTHSPIQYAAQLAGIPIKIWYSTNDVVTNSATVVPAFVAAVGSSASAVVVPGQTGLGHSVTGIDKSQIGSFLMAHRP